MNNLNLKLDKIFKKNINKEEQLLQKTINQYCEYKKIPFYCINNNVVPPIIDGIYNKNFAIKQAIKNKSMGLKKGVADAFIIYNNKTSFIEFKTINGKQKKEQKDFERICKLNKQNYFIVRSLEDFERILEQIELPSNCSSYLLDGAEIIKGQNNEFRKKR